MPSLQEHRTQWDINHSILKELKAQNRYPDWAATVAFYTALHSLERFFARHHQHPDNHDERKTILRTYKMQLGLQFLRDYLDMYNLSITARYECEQPTSKDIQEQLERLARIDAKMALTH